MNNNTIIIIIIMYLYFTILYTHKYSEYILQENNMYIIILAYILRF